MHSEAVGNPASACCMYGSARPPPWRREAGCLGEERVTGVLNSNVSEWLRVAFIDGFRHGTIPR